MKRWSMVNAVGVTACLLLVSCSDKQARTDLAELKAQQDVLKQQAEAERDNHGKALVALQQQNTELMQKLDQHSLAQNERVTQLEAQLEALSKTAAAPKNITVERAIEGAINISTLTDPAIRTLACPLLARLGSAAAEKRLIELARNDREVKVQSAALAGLVSIGSDQIIPLLNEAIVTAPVANRRALSEYMVKHCDKTSVAPAITALKELSLTGERDDQTTRKNLYKVVAKFGQTEDFELLKQLIKSEKSKASIISDLLEIRKGVFVPLLNESLKTATGSDLSRLAEYTIRHGNAESRRSILDALDRVIVEADYNTRYARRNLYRALAKFAKPADFDEINELLRLETNYKNEAMDVLVAIGSEHKRKVYALLTKSKGNISLDSDTLAILSRYADIRLTPYLVDNLKSGNYRSRDGVLNLLFKLQDPIAATFLVDYYNKSRSSSIGRRLASGFPGITYDAKARKAALMSDSVLKKLIEERNLKAAVLDGGDEKDDDTEDPPK